MRAYQFYNKLAESSKPTPISDKMAGVLNSSLNALIQRVKNFKDDNTTAKSKSFKPISLPSEKPVESLDEAVGDTEAKIKSAEDKLKTLRFMLQNFRDPKVGEIIQELENDVLELKNIHREELKGAGDVRQQEIENWFSGLDKDIMALAAKASSNSTIQKEITNRFKGSFTTEVLIKKNITKDDLTKFLQDAEEGKVIDMESLVLKDSGNINSYVGSEYKKVFDAIKADIFPYSPPGTGHNMGPGEVALTMFGNPITKGSVGDLNVNGVLYELKGAKTRDAKGKKSLSGGRMNGKDVSKPTTGRTAIVSWVKKNLGKDALNPYLEGTKLRDLNWNAKGIENLNTLFQTNIRNGAKRTIKLREFMLDLWHAMIQNHKEIENFDGRIQSMVSDNGTISDQAIRIITELLYESYALSDGEKDEKGNQKPFNIMVFNAQTLEYRIVRSTAGFAKQGIRVIGGIDWNDANASASPQLYID
jgi:hypothetical protein